jgi:hypothetical protein
VASSYLVRVLMPATGDVNLSHSWVRNKNGSGECEYTSAPADAMHFATEADAMAYVARERRTHVVAAVD